MYWFYHAWDFTATLLTAIGIGWFLDSWLQTSPWFTISLTIIGTVGGFIHINTMVKQWLANDNQKGKRHD